MTTEPILTAAADGFKLERLILYPNTGVEIHVRISDSVVYVLRVDSRGGMATVNWDGRHIFCNGECRPLGGKEGA